MFALFLLPFVLKKFMFYLCYLHSFTYTGAQHDLNTRRCSYRLTATRRVSPVEPVVSLPEHLSSPAVFSGIHVAQSLVFCVLFVDYCGWVGFGCVCVCVGGGGGGGVMLLTIRDLDINITIVNFKRLTSKLVGGSCSCIDIS